MVLVGLVVTGVVVVVTIPELVPEDVPDGVVAEGCFKGTWDEST